MAKHIIRGFFALLMTVTIVGGVVYIAQYGIDRQAEISRLSIETVAQQDKEHWQARFEALREYYVELVAYLDENPEIEQQARVRRLPKTEPDPIVVEAVPNGAWPSPYSYPQTVTPQRDPYVEHMERNLMPPRIHYPDPTESAPPFRPGSTDPNKRWEEFQQPLWEAERKPNRTA